MEREMSRHAERYGCGTAAGVTVIVCFWASDVLISAIIAAVLGLRSVCHWKANLLEQPDH